MAEYHVSQPTIKNVISAKTYRVNGDELPIPAPRINQVRGERTGNAVLTNAQAEEIRRLYRERKATQVKLAADYGISQSTVNNVIQGLRYA